MFFEAQKRGEKVRESELETTRFELETTGFRGGVGSV